MSESSHLPSTGRIRPTPSLPPRNEVKEQVEDHLLRRQPPK